MAQTAKSNKAGVTSVNSTPKKKERTEEEKASLKRELMLNINSYHVGSYKDAILDKLHNHIIQADGDYLVVNNKIGNFTVKMREASRPGLAEDIKGNKIQLKVPKIPGKIYYQIIAFFRDICDTMGNAEAFIQVYYDKINNKHVCNVPKQTVSGGSVNYDASENLNEIDRNRYVFMFEIHSHNTMGAFWSVTDNADEKETKFYGVFGKIKDATIEEKFRFMVMGKQIDVKREHVFDFSDTTISKTDILKFLETNNDTEVDTKIMIESLGKGINTFPAEWKENVNKPTYAGHTYSGGQGNYGSQTNAQQKFWEEDDHMDSWHTGNYAQSQKKTQGDGMTSYNQDIPADGDEDYIAIEETFDISNYELEFHSAIIETFVSSLDRMSIFVLLESLVEEGYDSTIKEYMRM